MQTSSEPELVSENSIEAPFGKRAFDEALVKGLKGVKGIKIWGALISSLGISIVVIISPSQRVTTLTPKPIEFRTTIDQVRIEGTEVIIPELVVELEKPKTIVKVLTPHQNPTPIEVLSFSSAKEIPPGAEAKAVLLTGATNGLIKAKLTESLKVDGASFLDAGTLLLGDGRSSEERLFVNFKKAVFRDGKYVAISAQAYDLSDSILGLKGSRVGDLTLKLAASSGLHFISGMASGLQMPEYDQFGRPKRPSTKDAALNGVSKASEEQAKSYMEDIKNRPPLIEVKSGTVFTVTFDGGN